MLVFIHILGHIYIYIYLYISKLIYRVGDSFVSLLLLLCLRFPKSSLKFMAASFGTNRSLAGHMPTVQTLPEVCMDDEISIEAGEITECETL